MLQQEVIMDVPARGKLKRKENRIKRRQKQQEDRQLGKLESMMTTQDKYTTIRNLPTTEKRKTFGCMKGRLLTSAEDCQSKKH